MKRRVLWMIPILLLWITACKQTPPAEEIILDPEAEKVAITEVLERYVIANETKDLDLVKQVWADKADIVVFGTESNERLVGWTAIEEAIRKQFSSFEDVYIAMTETEINLSQQCDAAWFSSMINYNFTYRDQPVSYEDLRFTGVLTKDEEGKWHIVQSHISVPAKPRNQWPVAKAPREAENMAADME